MRSIEALVLLGALACSSSTAGPAPRTQVREIAVTIDDLPGVSVVGDGVPALRAMTGRLLQAVRTSGAPAVGFVNEGKLGAFGQPDAERVAVLRLWLEAGLELGNHTFSHPDLHRTALPEFEADLVRGEDVTRALAASVNRPFRYFRHPFLHTGRDLATQAALSAFLAQRGYTVAPVTIDNADWIFARAYSKALARDDRAAADRVAAAYVPYMESKLEYFERQSAGLFGREVRQILLVHANPLNADRFGQLAAMMRRRGYRFVTLARALEDPAYETADTYTGSGGISWLHRWVMTLGKAVLPGEPDAPAFVMGEAGVTQE